MTQIDRASLKAMRPQIEAALKNLIPGLTFSLGSARFSDLQATFKLEVKVSDTKTVQDHAKQEWKIYASAYRLNENWFGKTFWMRTKKFTISGIDINKPKFCVKVIDQNGKGYGVPADVVIRSLTAGV
jgi:hypothetical protein